MKTYYIYLLAFLFLSVACKDAAKTSEAAKQKTTAKAVPTQPAKSAKTYPGIDGEILSYLYANSTYMDYIFHDLPFSMSQSEKASIQSSLANVSSEIQGSIPAGCKPIARQMFHVGGEIVREFDVYYSDGCAFFALVEKEKPIAINKMTEAGQNFYKSMIAQAMQTRQNVQK